MVARPNPAAPLVSTLSDMSDTSSGFHSTSEKHRRGSWCPIFLVRSDDADAAALPAALRARPTGPDRTASARDTCFSLSAPSVKALVPSTHSFTSDAGRRTGAAWVSPWVSRRRTTPTDRAARCTTADTSRARTRAYARVAREHRALDERATKFEIATFAFQREIVAEGRAGLTTRRGEILRVSRRVLATQSRSFAT